KAMSKDLGQYGIRVNTVCIGLIKSDQIMKKWQNDAPELSWEEYSRLDKHNIPLGRIGDTHEAANVITFLCSDLASYVSGAAVNIDGGSGHALKKRGRKALFHWQIYDGLQETDTADAG